MTGPSRGGPKHERATTRLFTVSGAVAQPGVIELPQAATVAQVVAAAGGVRGGGAPGAVQVGGPAGCWLPGSLCDLPFDDPRVCGVGSRLRSGSVVVAGAGTCAVDLARQSLAVLEHESCGRCVVCREGLMQMSEVVGDVAQGRGRPADLDLLLRLAQTLATTGPCGWGRTAANPVLSTLRHFGADYDAHAKGAPCPAAAVRAGDGA